MFGSSPQRRFSATLHEGTGSLLVASFRLLFPIIVFDQYDYYPNYNSSINECQYKRGFKSGCGRLWRRIISGIF
jgi:hypothetical protein